VNYEKSVPFMKCCVNLASSFCCVSCCSCSCFDCGQASVTKCRGGCIAGRR